MVKPVGPRRAQGSVLARAPDCRDGTGITACKGSWLEDKWGLVLPKRVLRAGRCWRVRVLLEGEGALGEASRRRQLSMHL